MLCAFLSIRPEGMSLENGTMQRSYASPAGVESMQLQLSQNRYMVQAYSQFFHISINRKVIFLSHVNLHPVNNVCVRELHFIETY